MMDNLNSTIGVIGETTGAHRVVRRKTKNTFGGRLRTCREERGLTQEDVVKLLAEHGISITAANLSKLELGDTQRPYIPMLTALCQIYGTSLHYIFTGNELEEKAMHWSEEADAIAEMVDKMSKRSRGLMRIVAAYLVETDNEERRNDVELIRFVESVDAAFRHLLSDTQRRALDNILHNADSVSSIGNRLN